ncbi:MAG: hypothetical protein M3R59_08760 [Verrucomicrobiota bacterium]|nr:hypothetical protein [Verrucomicrobiota bacterium]
MQSKSGERYSPSNATGYSVNSIQETMRKILFFILMSVALLSEGYARDVDFDALLKNPSKYDRQEVTVTGLLEVGGSENGLWREARALQRKDLHHFLLLVPNPGRKPLPGTNYSPDAPANLHWVKVTGIFDRRIQGHLGFLSFGLSQQNIQVLSGPRLKQLLPILAWIRNVSGVEAKIDVQAGNQGTFFTLNKDSPPESAAIERGRFTVIANDHADRLLAKAAVMYSESGRYYDRDKRAYYFNIKKGAVERVLPQDARGWDFDPSPERD